MNTAKKEHDETGHFNKAVPQALRDKMFALTRYVKENAISDYEGAGMGKDAYGCARADAIYGYHIPGFFPFTHGGYEVSELYANGSGSGAFFTEGEAESAESDHIDAARYFFMEEKGLGYVEAGEKAKSDFWGELTQEEKEKLYEHECENEEPTLLRFEVWKEKVGGIEMRFSCNYRDAPHYRTESDEDLHGICFPVAAFMEMTEKEIMDTLIQGGKENGRL